jgi:hypothetical protein
MNGTIGTLEYYKVFKGIIQGWIGLVLTIGTREIKETPQVLVVPRGFLRYLRDDKLLRRKS